MATERRLTPCRTTSASTALAARGFIVLPDQETAFVELETGLRSSLFPDGELQEIIFKCVLESAWNLHRCRLAEAHLYMNSLDPTIDPLLDDQHAAKHERIHKYSRQSEASMHKSLLALGKLQTESQYRHEAFPLTVEQATDPEQFSRTPHSLSEACSFGKAMAAVIQQKNAEASNRRKESSATTRNLFAQIKACAPSRHTTMISTSGPGAGTAAAAAA